MSGTVSEAAGTSNERITEQTYDASGNNLTVKRVGDARTTDAITSRTYDSSRNMISETDPEGNTTQFVYDAMGNLVARKDARNKAWTYAYDNMAKLVSATDPLNHSVSYEYDEVGNKTKETDPEGKVKSYEYDNNNRLTKMTDALGNVTQSVYNTDGNLIKQIDQEGKSIAYEYDLDGRLTKNTDGNGNVTTKEYNDAPGSSCASCPGSPNGLGQPARIIYPTFSRTYAYDSRGRKIEERVVLSETEAYSTQFAYDAVGNLIAQTDNESRTTTYQYDELGRMVKEIDPLGNATEYTYDNRNNLLTVKDAKGNTRTFQYDRNDRLTKDTRPLGQATIYQYDAVGNLVQQIDAKGQRTETEYDAVGRLTTTKYFATVTDTIPVRIVKFTYDSLANLTGYDDGTTSATYTYDDAYRKLSETVNYGNFELTYSYSYYKNGLKKSLTMPDGTAYEYTYDNNNQLTMIKIPGQGSITYNKYKWTMPDAITLPGGTRRDNTYDPLMQLKSLVVKDAAQNPLMTYNYDYSPAGNVTAKNTDRGNYTYQYDPLYRLTGAVNPASNEAYTYDAVGNRLTSTVVQGPWSYSGNNELLSYNGVSYEYDGNGNAVKIIDQSGSTNYVYDVDNRLIQIRNSQSEIYNYYYDPFGKRLSKEVSGVRTYFFYSDEGLIGEYDSTGGEIKTYGYVPDSDWTTKPLFQKIATNYYWYQNHHLGTPQKLVDTNGRIVWSATYSPFGNIQVTTAEIENNHRLPGQYYDRETGLHYNYHRYYNLEIGRYMAADPIGLGGGINVYAYVQNNPINSIDPVGLWVDELHRHITREALTGLNCAKHANELGNAIANVDHEKDSQEHYNAIMHCMVDGKLRKDQWPQDNKRFYDLVERGRNSCGGSALAHALHALQDCSAPGHGLNKPWYGPGLGYFKHWRDGNYNEPSLPDAIEATQEFLFGVIRRCPCVCETGFAK